MAQRTEFLSWKIVPARLDALQAARFLGFEPPPETLPSASQPVKLLCCEDPLGRIIKSPQEGKLFFIQQVERRYAELQQTGVLIFP